MNQSKKNSPFLLEHNILPVAAAPFDILRFVEEMI